MYLYKILQQFRELRSKNYLILPNTLGQQGHFSYGFIYNYKLNLTRQGLKINFLNKEFMIFFFLGRIYGLDNLLVQKLIISVKLHLINKIFMQIEIYCVSLLLVKLALIFYQQRLQLQLELVKQYNQYHFDIF